MQPHLVLAQAIPPQPTELLRRLSQWGIAYSCASTQEELWSQLERGRDTIVLLGLPDPEAILEKLSHQGFESVILLMERGANVQLAARAIKQGAHDAFSDPIDFACLRQSINELSQRDDQPEKRPTAASPPHEMLGNSEAFERVRQQISEVAPTDATVLILGESGTGKELVARAVHEQSNRNSGPYLPVNMAALPETLAEGALFGHRQGAFTGADRDQKGWCESADGGTLFLDEIGELDLGLQAKLLRFLESKSFQRIGASVPSQVDVRIIAATNREPLEMIQSGKLRSDLYYRLNVFPVQLPSLSQRHDDIPLLANAFLKKAAIQYGKSVQGFSDVAMQDLQNFAWPGNIRELENVVHRVVISATRDKIDSCHLPAEITSQPSVKPTTPPAGPRMEQIERKAIVDALRSADGNAVSAAKILGVGQATIYRKMKRYGIPLKVGRRVDTQTST